MLRFLTAGESHGPCLTTIVEGLPAGLELTPADVDTDLKRRQGGYGRGGRQRIECDQVQFQGGLVHGRTIGAPISMLVPNRDYANWQERDVPAWTRPRPGHADWPGAIKYGLADMRLVAERASARETAARVAAGAVAKKLLASVGIAVGSYVQAIGQASMAGDIGSLDTKLLRTQIDQALRSDVACPDQDAADRMRAEIDSATQQGDSLGGLIVVIGLGVPVGLGTHAHWDRRLDGRIAQAMLGIQAVKGVEIGPAFENAQRRGTRVHDELFADEGRLMRTTNRAGGLEGGITNGEPVVVRLAMKPIPTTIKSLATVDVLTGEPASTQYQRSDVCAVPAAAVVGETMLAWVLAQVLLERYGGDSISTLVRRVSDDR